MNIPAAAIVPVAVPPIPLEVQQKMREHGFEPDALGLVAYDTWLKQWISTLSAHEMEVRKLAVAHTFVQKKEGTNRLAIGDGKEVKAVIKYNYGLKLPEGSTAKNLVEAVDMIVTKARRISNECAFVVDRLFNYKVDIAVSELRKLQEEAKEDKNKAALLKEIQPLLNVSEAAPTLDIVPAKVKK